MDLSQTDAPEQIYHICKQKNLTIQHLINNAWFGGYGFFQNQDWIQHISMIQTNIIALTQLTYLCLPDMIAHKNGKILQVASTAGMIPGPMQAVYHATKAYVLSLSQALAKELEWTGVTVTALCPWPVDTNFAQVAHLQNSQIFKHAVKANVVAQDWFHALMNGELVVVSGLPMYYRFLLGMMPLFPRSFILNQAKKAICISSDNP